MWIQVRSMDGKKLVRIDGLSKLTKVDVLREKLVEPFDAPVERQRLFYRGKQLEDDHTLFDYNVGLNEIIQIMVRPAAAVEVPAKKVEDEEPKEEIPEVSQDKEETSSEGQESGYQEGSDSGDSLYKMGDIIDARDPTMGAWFEAKITKIIPYTNDSQLTSLSDDKNENSEENKMEVEEEEMNNNNNEKDPVDKSDVNADSNEQTESQTDSNNSTDKTDGESNDAEDDKENDGGDSDKENQPSLSNTSSDEGKVKPALTETNSNTDQKPSPDVSGGLDNYVYHLVFDGYEEDEPLKVRSKHVRPRARNKLKLDTLELGDKVMVNYNYDSPEDRGYWYDAVVTSKRSTRTIKELFGTVYIGADLIPMEKCQILFYDEIFAIEKPGSQQNIHEDLASSPVKRQNKPECDHCHDNPRRKCKFCACNKCGDKKDPDKQILCDECDMAYHIYCLDPPLTSIPDEDEWYCPTCKNDETEIVRAGEKLKESKKKSKMASATSTSSRDWGKGMACAGRTKECTIVPPDHFGPIPGVEVGTMWKFRVQVSEAGIHRPHVAGIHGRADVGAFSIVLSGGYEDDVDRGEEFTYTGSGGRDLSGNKRTAEQSCDQKLTRMNCALAKNCNASLDAKKGATATNWKNGKPVRVVRNCKGSKHSKYAPEEGNRYDGIYKIVKYWPAKGKSGFLVWRYLLRRDDPIPAPWTKAGQKRTTELGLVMQYPAGYEEAQKLKEENSTPGKKRGKRKREESDDEDSPVRKKAAVFKLSEEVEKLIKNDSENEKIWEEVMEYRKEGSKKFLGKVEEMFLCVCCQELVYKPVTTSCSHNICKSCLQRSFKAEVYCCPFCRNELGKDYSLATNKNLSKILLDLFPGYENGR